MAENNSDTYTIAGVMLCDIDKNAENDEASKQLENDDLNCKQLEDYVAVPKQTINKNLIEIKEDGTGSLKELVSFQIHYKHLRQDVRTVTVFKDTQVLFTPDNRVVFQYNWETTVNPSINLAWEKARKALKHTKGSFFKLPNQRTLSTATGGGKRKSRKPAKKVKRRRTHRRN